MDPIEKHFAHRFNKERHTHHIEEARKERQAQAVQHDGKANEANCPNFMQSIVKAAKRIRSTTPKPESVSRSDSSQSVDLDSTIMI